MAATYNARDYKNQNHLVQKATFSKMVSGLDIKPGFRCLDVGCGPGNFTKLLVDLVGKNGYILGIDPDEDRISLAKETNSHISNLDFLCLSGGNLPTDLPKFDVVYSSNVLHWMTDEEKWKTFQRIFRLMKPGGTFAFVTVLELPYALKEVFCYVEDRRTVPHFLYTELPSVLKYKQKLTECGFEVVNIQALEHASVFHTTEQFLSWLSATMHTEINLGELCQKHKIDLKIQTNKDGEYTLNVRRIWAYAKKQNALF